MDALPDFQVLNPTSLDEAIAARAAHPDSKPLGGGTDLVVNIRRGIVAPAGLDRHEPRAGVARDQSRRDRSGDRRRGDARRTRRRIPT